MASEPITPKFRYRWLVVVALVCFSSTAGVVYAVVHRRGLTLFGEIVERAPPGRVADSLRLSTGQIVEVGPFSTEHDLQQLSVGDRLEKKAGELGLWVNGQYRPWAWRKNEWVGWRQLPSPNNDNYISPSGGWSVSHPV